MRKSDVNVTSMFLPMAPPLAFRLALMILDPLQCICSSVICFFGGIEVK